MAWSASACGPPRMTSLPAPRMTRSVRPEVQDVVVAIAAADVLDVVGGALEDEVVAEAGVDDIRADVDAIVVAAALDAVRSSPPSSASSPLIPVVGGVAADDVPVVTTVERVAPASPRPGVSAPVPPLRRSSPGPPVRLSSPTHRRCGRCRRRRRRGRRRWREDPVAADVAEQAPLRGGPRSCRRRADRRRRGRAASRGRPCRTGGRPAPCRRSCSPGVAALVGDGGRGGGDRQAERSARATARRWRCAPGPVAVGERYPRPRAPTTRLSYEKLTDSARATPMTPPLPSERVGVVPALTA